MERITEALIVAIDSENWEQAESLIDRLDEQTL